jgi:hypothetical protein
MAGTEQGMEGGQRYTDNRLSGFAGVEQTALLKAMVRDEAAR